MAGGDREEEEESEMEGDCASTPVKQRKTGVDRDGEGERGFRHLRVFLFCLWSTESFNFGFRPQFRQILRSKNVVFTPSNTGISWISLFYVSEH